MPRTSTPPHQLAGKAAREAALFPTSSDATMFSTLSFTPRLKLFHLPDPAVLITVGVPDAHPPEEG